MKWRRAIEAKGLQAHALLVCSDDLPHWVNYYCWTYDPREPQNVLPFDLFPKQEAFLAWLADREAAQEDGLVEKSRDVGVTWLCCAFALHRWLFRPGCAIGFGSRKLDLVDKLGDPDSIFEKIRFLLEHLPAWMLPQGYSRDKHSAEAKLVNPANGSTITGEGGDNIGRGGRKSLYIVDEAAYLERPSLVERSLSQTTRCRIDVSTPNGSGNPFAEKRFSGRVPVFVLDWKDDPRKNACERQADGTLLYPWYEAQKRRHDPVTLAQELDRDYTASLEGITIPGAWVRAAVNLALPASGDCVAGLDVAESGKNRSVFIPRRGPVVGTPVAWGQANTTETAHRAKDEAIREGATALCYDAIGVGAGVRGALDSSERYLPFTAIAVNTGSAPSDITWPDGRTSKERFLNLRAELWWLVRARFEKAYEFVEKGIKHPPEEMISIPNHPQLIAELSQPLHHRTSGGKIQIESKEAMAKRGVKSPDYADALCLAFAVDTGKWEARTHPAARSEMADYPAELDFGADSPWA